MAKSALVLLNLFSLHLLILFPNLIALLEDRRTRSSKTYTGSPEVDIIYE